MHKNILWLTFLGIVGVVTLWFTGVATYRYYEYTDLNSHTTTSSVEWLIKEHTEDNYTLEAYYQFKANNHLFKGVSHFADESHLNRWAAEQMIKSNSSHLWTVWYAQNNPDHSSLQKNFPIKECLSAIFLIGLFLYFLWLGFYVARFKT